MSSLDLTSESYKICVLWNINLLMGPLQDFDVTPWIPDVLPKVQTCAENGHKNRYWRCAHWPSGKQSLNSSRNLCRSSNLLPFTMILMWSYRAGSHTADYQLMLDNNLTKWFKDQTRKDSKIKTEKFYKSNHKRSNQIFWSQNFRFFTI